jgi:hypothetical protein
MSDPKSPIFRFFVLGVLASFCPALDWVSQILAVFVRQVDICFKKS